MRIIGLYAFTTLYAGSVLLALYRGWGLGSLIWLFSMALLVLACVRAVGGPVSRTVPWAVAGALLAVARLAMVPSGEPLAISQILERPANRTGVIVSIPDVRETGQKVTVDLAPSGTHVKVLASAPLYPILHAGDRVRLTGTLTEPEPFETDGGRTFAYDAFLRKDGISAVMSPARVEPIGRSASLWLTFLRTLEALKQALTRAVDLALPEPESALAVGILVGGKQGLGARLIADFTASGMLQIIVLSGFNVMIVASTLMKILAPLPKRLSFQIALGSILSFVLMAGAGSSAMRAGLMASLALASRTFEREYNAVAAVCLTLVGIALYDPLTLAYDPGFQFSFIATLGLIIGTPILVPFLSFLKSDTLIELVATTLAAEIALLPLLLYETGNLSYVSVLANILAMPVIPFAMGASTAAAFLALLVSPISSILPVILGVPAYVPLAYVIRVATLAASLPHANRILSAFPFWIVPTSYAALAALVYGSKQLRPGSGFPPRPSSGSRRRRQRTIPCPTDGNRSCTHAPTDR